MSIAHLCICGNGWCGCWQTSVRILWSNRISTGNWFSFFIPNSHYHVNFTQGGLFVIFCTLWITLFYVLSRFWDTQEMKMLRSSSLAVKSILTMWRWMSLYLPPRLIQWFSVILTRITVIFIDKCAICMLYYPWTSNNIVYFLDFRNLLGILWKTSSSPSIGPTQYPRL